VAGSAEKRRNEMLFGDPPSKQTKQGDGIYQEILALELAESEHRLPSQDTDLLKSTCQELREHMEAIMQLKLSQGGAEAEDEINERRIQGSLLFVTLKKLNRLEKLRVKRCREGTKAAKQNVDKFNLQLQNLLYEVLHLKKEVTKCINYKSADQDIHLISEKDFYQEAPGDTSRPEVTKRDSHLQRLARLEWELSTRKKLGEECQALEIERSRLSVEIGEKEDKLEKLAPQLVTVLDAAKPVQEYLSLPVKESNLEKEPLEKLLPDSLYILYTQAKAYSQCQSDEMVKVSVEGAEQEAMVWREEQQKKCFYPEEEAKEAVEEEDEEMEVEGVNAKEIKLLKRHPLCVKMEVKTELGESLSCKFHFLLELGILTVETELNVKAGGNVDPNNVLADLYQGDTGKESPNPSNQFQLKAGGLSENFEEYVARCGRPYMWAQRLGGLEFLPLVRRQEGDQTVEINGDSGLVEYMQMEDAVKKMRARLLSCVTSR